MQTNIVHSPPQDLAHCQTKNAQTCVPDQRSQNQTIRQLGEMGEGRMPPCRKRKQKEPFRVLPPAESKRGNSNFPSRLMQSDISCPLPSCQSCLVLSCPDLKVMAGMLTMHKASERQRACQQKAGQPSTMLRQSQRAPHRPLTPAPPSSLGPPRPETLSHRCRNCHCQHSSS